MILVFDAPTAVAAVAVGQHNSCDANEADNMNLVDIGTVCVAFVHVMDCIVVPFVAFPHVLHATMATLVRNALVAIAIGLCYLMCAALDMIDHVSLPAAPMTDR